MLMFRTVVEFECLRKWFNSVRTNVLARTETHIPHDGHVRHPLSITSQNVANADSTAPAGPTVVGEAVPGSGSVDSLETEGSSTRGATG